MKELINEAYKSKNETRGTEDTEGNENDEDRDAKEKVDDLHTRQNLLNNSEYLSDDDKHYMNYCMEHTADPVSVVEAFEKKKEAGKNEEEMEL